MGLGEVYFRVQPPIASDMMTGKLMAKRAKIVPITAVQFVPFFDDNTFVAVVFFVVG